MIVDDEAANKLIGEYDCEKKRMTSALRKLRMGENSHSRQHKSYE